MSMTQQGDLGRGQFDALDDLVADGLELGLKSGHSGG
jgi:hypothetical protein